MNQDSKGRQQPPGKTEDHEFSSSLNPDQKNLPDTVPPLETKSAKAESSDPLERIKMWLWSRGWLGAVILVLRNAP